MQNDGFIVLFIRKVAMLVAICISFAVLAGISLVVVFIRSRRAIPDNRASDSARRRAVMDDCGDDVVWETGRLQSIVPEGSLEAAGLSKRAFLRRFALGIFVFMAAWLAPRRKSMAAFDRDPHPEKSRFSGKEGSARTEEGINGWHTDNHMDGPHGDSNDHNDSHTDSGGDSHGDFHSDSPGTHTDGPTTDFHTDVSS